VNELAQMRPSGVNQPSQSERNKNVDGDSKRDICVGRAKVVDFHLKGRIVGQKFKNNITASSFQKRAPPFVVVINTKAVP